MSIVRNGLAGSAFRVSTLAILLELTVLLWSTATTTTAAADEPVVAEKTKAAGKAEAPTVDTKPAGPDASGLVKISKEHDVWIDLKRKIVVVDGEICLREGQLEMFACPKGTKEHESVVAVKSDAKTVHAGLLAVGAKEGTPVKFAPQYEPATGTPVEILVLWTDKEGQNKKVRAQEFIRNAKTGKEMDYSWVFAGSKFWTDEDTGQKYYQGDSGDLVCVSNFPTATLDLPVESSDANAQLMFEAFQDRIPPRGTKVRLVFMPKVDKKPDAPAPNVKPGDRKGADSNKPGEKPRP